MSPPHYYQPLPQEKETHPKGLPAHNQAQDDVEALGHTRPAFSWKRALYYTVSAAVLLQVAYVGVQWSFGGHTGGRSGRGHRRLGTPCHGAHKDKSVYGSLPSHYTLPSGDRIPSVALGVWQAEPNEVGEAVKVALKSGYRHIDDAWIYKNEHEVGQALRESGVPREEIWLTSKLFNSFHAPEDVEEALDDSLTKLGVDYLDLYLIHWPIAVKKGTADVVDEDLTANPYPTWKKLEEMVDKGKVRNIGISNFNIPRIRNLTANPLKYKPAVNQVELSYWNPQPELVKWAKENDLLLEAYSPLGGGTLVKETLDLPVVKEIARALHITPAQVIISWHVQRGTVVLPKSVTPSRVVENYHVTKLPETLFQKLEDAATSHPPKRVLNPSTRYNLGYDLFDDDGGVIVPDDME
ncbi:NADP-dependent oxidoreductase domain-containing protein [Epithele typhae]|uniref:NADP-dependent oxidoreductase domain-containing protein n=1 Tax=Epithele typhae TaxID=378194 RepID=UPI00200865BA|nr:NADP-dependent oxidoreductase domain-containing protein [Epithele typhae]KAH9932757.1 NADP-dependent oxidoreductase domain-containing protein [Epithele typhae]